MQAQKYSNLFKIPFPFSAGLIAVLLGVPVFLLGETPQLPPYPSGPPDIKRPGPPPTTYPGPPPEGPITPLDPAVIEEFLREQQEARDKAIAEQNQPPQPRGSPVSRFKDVIANATILIEETRPTETPDEFVRLAILEQDGDLPLLRIESRVLRDPDTGKDRFLAEWSTVADRTFVTLQPGVTSNQLEAFAQAQGGWVVSSLEKENSFEVKFPVIGLETVPDGIEILNSAASLVRNAFPINLGAVSGTGSVILFSGSVVSAD